MTVFTTSRACTATTEELWFPEWEFKGTPWTNPAMYSRWSPHKFVQNFNTPILIIHGELDYRVPIGEGMQLFTAVQRKGIDSKMLIFPDEGHWVLKPQNSQLWFHTVLDWLDKYLQPTPPRNDNRTSRDRSTQTQPQSTCGACRKTSQEFGNFLRKRSMRLWAEEAVRRDAELDSGTASMRDAEDVFRDARARIS